MYRTKQQTDRDTTQTICFIQHLLYDNLPLRGCESCAKILAYEKVPTSTTNWNFEIENLTVSLIHLFDVYNFEAKGKKYFIKVRFWSNITFIYSIFSVSVKY